MAIEIKIPSVGESITEALLSEWFKEDGDRVRKDEPIFVLETDKVTLEIEAEADGVLHIKVQAGETVGIGDVVGTIETETGAEEESGQVAEQEKEEPGKKAEEEKKAEPSEEEEKSVAKEKPPGIEDEKEIKEKPAEKKKEEKEPEKYETPQLSPSVRRLVEEKNVDPDRIYGTGPGGKITKGDVILFLESQATAEPSEAKIEKVAARPSEETVDEPTERKPMTPIRKRIAARLLESKQNTAMLTTFNEIDMSRAMETRSRHKDRFKNSHGVALGFMSFFIKASVGALKEFPEINASIEGDDIVYHRYYHIGVAIGTGKGLVVPVIKHADRLSYAGIEKAIIDYVGKVKEKRLDISDMEGGTFTITNGGVFGSLLSTPILNYPQSGILGMHKIEKRPVVVDDQIVIRPMMYVALSYDHRIVDGREAVTFLRRIKEFIEDPERMLLEI